MSTYSEAIDEMYSILHNAVNDHGPTYIGMVPDVQYEGVKADEQSLSSFWLRASVRQAEERQVTLGSDRFGVSEYSSHGLLFIQLFIPRSIDTALGRARLLAQAIRNEYRKYVNGSTVHFTEVTLRELPPENRWYVINIIPRYNFFELV